MKIVQKHWGYEEWLELNSSYCFKRIFIKSGCRTSLQYHMKKLETNCIVSGKALVLLEREDGTIEETEMTQNSIITVLPGRKHRITAITDILMYEVSTPEVDDVIRLADDNNRPNGFIAYEHSHKI